MKLKTLLILAICLVLNRGYSVETPHILLEEPLVLEAQDEFVYIQQSRKGTLTQSSEGYYTLTLQGNNLDIIYFADQPSRVTGHQDLNPFFRAWSSSEKELQHLPTAFINYTQFNPSTEAGVTPDILQLRNPRYNAEEDILTFEVNPLHEYQIKEGIFENIVIIYDKE
jgi:hypothetical protein